MVTREKTAEKLTAIWGEMLDTSDLAHDDDFFTLGGDSFLALRLLDQVRAEFGAVVSFATFLEGPTIDELTAVIDATEDA